MVGKEEVGLDLAVVNLSIVRPPPARAKIFELKKLKGGNLGVCARPEAQQIASTVQGEQKRGLATEEIKNWVDSSASKKERTAAEWQS